MAKSAAKAIPILTAEDYDTIEQARSRIDQVRAAIDQVEQCGVDCTQQRQDLVWAEESLAKFRLVLFPGGRPR